MNITRKIAVGSAGLLALAGSGFAVSVATSASASTPFAPVVAAQSIDAGANLDLQVGAQDATGPDTAGVSVEGAANESATIETATSDGVGGNQDPAGSLGTQGGTQQ